MIVKRIGILGNPRKPGLELALEKFLPMAERNGVRWSISKELEDKCDRPREEFLEDAELAGWADIIVAFGGDGTILKAARIAGPRGIPVLGVNLGKLGFLAEIGLEELDDGLGKLLCGDFEVEERIALEAWINEGDDDRVAGLNDIVIGRVGFSRTIEVEIVISGELVSLYTADGLIISTPTGSTAYSLSAGGPILYPTMDALIITPICPLVLSICPMVVPGDRLLAVTVRSDHEGLVLTADGQVERKLRSGDRIFIRRADYLVKLINLRGKSFYEVLRTKLMWGVGRSRFAGPSAGSGGDPVAQPTAREKLRPDR